MEELRRKRGPLLAEPYGRWEEEARELIQEKMAADRISYKQLSRMLEQLGIYESPDQVNRKVNRKRFSAAFLIACLRAMGVERITLMESKQGQKREG
jgi:3-mercaptopyruvate sulfurtransferase SseA